VKKLLIIFLSFFLIFTPLSVSTEPVFSEEGLFIPKEDLEILVKLFALVGSYDDLIYSSLGDIYRLTEDLREEINKRMKNGELNQDIIDLMSSFFNNYSEINNMAFNYYMVLLENYGQFSKETMDFLEKLLKYMGKM
jgi:cytochrome c-type biogenesis protein CcmH/NrfF